MRDILKRHGVAAGFIILTLAVLGLFCVYLNQQFYRRFGPFFDSLSYDETLFQVMRVIRTHGVADAFALTDHSTVMLPWLQAALLAPFLSPSRAIGIWLQISWMMVTALAGYVYFRRITHYDRLSASCGALMFFFVAGTFFWDGGVSDFRMDYLQYILFGLIFYVYAIARKDGRLWLWAAWGGTVALACLARATTPVYVGLVYGPFFLVDLWQRRVAALAVIKTYVLAGISCIALCGWFYVMRGPFLYYYYFDWNLDANAHLPLRESLHHLNNVFAAFGSTAVIAGAVIFALNIALWTIGRRSGGWNFRPLWAGIVPVGFLILSGAGLNPFVSEVAVFGLLLFLLAPVEAESASRLRAGIMLVSLVAMAAIGSYAGFQAHTDQARGYVAEWVPTHDSLAQISDCITHDIEQGPPGRRSFSSVFTGSVNSDILMNFLIFDSGREADIERNGSFSVPVGTSMLSMSQARSDVLVTPTQWADVPGIDDAAKLSFLTKQVAKGSDYFIIPSSDSRLPATVTIDNYARELAGKLAEEVYLKPLCRRIQTGVAEFVTVYRKDPTKPPAGAATPGIDSAPPPAIAASGAHPAAPLPPGNIDSFPDGLNKPGLFFAGVTPAGWLSDRARTVLSLGGISDQLHLTGKPGSSPKIAAGTLRITVDGVSVLERPEGAEPFDLVVPIPPGQGSRKIELLMTGLDQLAEADNRTVSLRLSSIGLERREPDDAPSRPQ